MNKNVLKKVGNCAKLETLILNGSTSFGDDGIGQLAHGDDLKFKPEGFSKLKLFKVSGIDGISDNGLLKILSISPNL